MTEPTENGDLVLPVAIAAFEFIVVVLKMLYERITVIASLHFTELLEKKKSVGGFKS